MQEIIDDIVQKITTLTDKFYQHADKRRFHKFEEIVIGLTELTEQIELAAKTEGKTYVDEIEYLRIFQDLTNALENRDETLIADIMQYDLLDLLIGIREQLH